MARVMKPQTLLQAGTRFVSGPVPLQLPIGPTVAQFRFETSARDSSRREMVNYESRLAGDIGANG